MFNRKKQRWVVLIIAIMISVGLLASTILYSVTPGVGGPTPGSLDAQIQALTTSIAGYESTLNNDPDNLANGGLWIALGNARYDLAEIYYQKNQQDEKVTPLYQGAVEAYKKALESDPKNLSARVDMATAAMYAGDLDFAEENFQRAIEEDEKHFQAHFNYGVLLAFGRNNPIGAIEQWELLKTLDLDAATAGQVDQLIEQAKGMIGSAPPFPMGSGAPSDVPPGVEMPNDEIHGNF